MESILTGTTDVVLPLHPTPFDIPEILENILSHLDQRTLGHSAILVNHTWLYAGRQSILHEFIWDDRNSQKRHRLLEQALKRLPYMHRVHWHASQTLDTQFLRVLQWQSFCEALDSFPDSRPPPLTSAMTPQQGDLHSRTLDVFSHRRMQGSETSVSCNGLEDSFLFPLRQGNSPIQLHEIELSGPFDPEMIPSLLPSLAFLTRLTLRLTGIHSLQMSMVLGSCDSLQDLFMSSDEIMILPGPWVPPHYPPHHPGFLLRSLVLMNAHFQQRELESLLATTPRLKRLKIVNPIEGIFDNSGIGDVNHNPVLLVRSIKALSLNLEQCYFPHRFDTIASQTSLDVCPTSPELVICLEHYSSFDTLSNLIRNPPNVVTTLEIVGRNNFYDGTSSKALHQYLCSSPHLLHLKAPYVGFRVDHMDICGRVDHSSLLGTQRTATMKGMPASTTTTALEYTPGIWACRDLKTLHLRILGPLDGCGYIEVRRAGCSRVVYGYISRVCPNLRDLYLASGDGYGSPLNGGCLGVQMSGGLCMLGRLQDLERLRIETRKAMPTLPQDIEWIVEAGRTMEKKQERRRALAQWSTIVDMDQSAQDVHLKDKKDGLSVLSLGWKGVRAWGLGQLGSLGWKSVEAWRMRRTLEHLGSLVDVRMAFEEMDGLDEEEKGKRYFPLLQSASFGCLYGIYLPVEVEVKRVLAEAAMTAEKNGKAQ